MEYKKLTEVLGDGESESRDTNPTSVRKEIEKAFPKHFKPLPTCVKNIEGKVITNPDEKKMVVLDHFRH